MKSNDANDEHLQVRYEQAAMLCGIVQALSETAKRQANESELETYDRIVKSMHSFAREDLNPEH